MVLIDTHCHVFTEQFDIDRAEVMERAAGAGVRAILMPNIDSASLKALYSVKEAFPALCHVMLGLHPTDVKEDFEAQLASIFQSVDAPGIVGIGEIGLDFYWDKTFIEEQKQALRKQLELAGRWNLPVSLHTRESTAETLLIVKDVKREYPGLKGVFHCFSGTAAQAREILDMGDFCLGIGGVVTFKNGGMAGTLKDLPLSAFVLETDAPYLAPAPHRGKRNEPAFLPLINKRLAEILAVSETEMAAATTENALRLFPISLKG